MEVKESDQRADNGSLYIAGRYNKFSRNLCQTPWILDGVRRMETSVQELIVDQVEKRIKFEKARFSSSGREDVDVRMLGDGRPFVIELIKPQVITISDQLLDEIEKSINSNCSDVQVRYLQLMDKNEVKVQLRAGETDKMKVYRALCCIDRPFTDQDIDKLKAIKDLIINQKTPIRVLHRRSLLDRTRTIHHILGEKTQDEHKFIIELKTEAGTYIKEFVHGDFGRTSPNLAQILENCRTDILELDVTEITINWPGPKSDRAEIPITSQEKCEPKATESETLGDHEVCSKKIKLNQDD